MLAKVYSTVKSDENPDAQACTAVSNPNIQLIDLPAGLILEIFSRLDAKALSLTACTCRLFRLLAEDSLDWKGWFCERWEPPTSNCDASQVQPHRAATASGVTWKELYADRELRSRAFMGKFEVDFLQAHTAGVRCVRMVSNVNLVATGGYDSTVRLWDLQNSYPLAASQPLGGTIRVVAIDEDLLLAAGTEGLVHVWGANPKCPYRFDITGVYSVGSANADESILVGHSGPISCLGLDKTNMYSGSWDMSVKIWSREQDHDLLGSLPHPDWVWALVVRGSHCISAGGLLHTWDIPTQELLWTRQPGDAGQIQSVEATRSGHLVFAGHQSGVVSMFDERVPKRGGSAVEAPIGAWPVSSLPVCALSFDDPWLAAACGDGTVAMIDVRTLSQRPSRKVAGSAQKGGGRAVLSTAEGGDTTRLRSSGIQRRLGGGGKSLHCVSIGADRVVSGGEECTLRVWNFTQALEKERCAQAARSMKVERRSLRMAEKLTDGEGRRSQAYRKVKAQDGKGEDRED